MPQYIRQTLSYYILLAAGCWIIFCTPSAQAANEETIAAAHKCTQQQWTDKAGHERAQTYRKAVDCFKTVYIRVATDTHSNEALEKELTKQLDELEAAYHASRNVCRLQQKLGVESQGCGTGSLSPHEFVHLLKTMILNADAGWVRRDPALAKALGLQK